MICAKINGPTLFDARRQLNYASDFADMAELRMDLWVRHKVEEVEKLIREHPDIPLIFVLRPKKESSELRRINEIEELAVLRPGYFDIEAEMPPEIRRTLIAKFPKIQWITSVNLAKFDENELSAIYEQHTKDFPKVYLKITIKVNAIPEALEFCRWVHQRKDPHLIGIAEGPYGQISRILSPILGNPWTYAATDEKPNALGLLSAQTFRETYHLRKNRTLTTFLVHLEKPGIATSLKNLCSYYNKALEELHQPAVFVELETPELEHCWNALRQLPLYGATFGVGYKEEIMPYLDYIDPIALKVEAVNTVLFESNYSYGFNTEGFGVVDAIEKVKEVYNESIGILGAGCTARAAAYEARQRGAHVTIYNRTESKAKKVAFEFDCETSPWGKWKDHAIWINATPADPDISLRKGHVLVELDREKTKSSLVDKAKNAETLVIYGEDVFHQETSSQLFLWFKKE